MTHGSGRRAVETGAPPRGNVLMTAVDRISNALGRSSIFADIDFDDETHPWFLSAEERANPDTRIRAWTEGNRCVALVHGDTYFRVLNEHLADAKPDDLVLFTDWRGDPEQVLTDRGPTVEDALTGAATRGVVVRGLLWRSHAEGLGYTGGKNSALATALEDAGGECVLDQRVLAFGSHHQKLVVMRSASRPGGNVAFVGGIDLARSRRDDAHHHGDALSRPFPPEYGETPAWHDLQLEMRGPAVRDVEDTFRERWEDPAALSRLPWHVVSDVVRRHRREPSELPAALPDPEATGTCSVQLLRTYPRRRPSYPFAQDGERSAARAYAKALGRAERLIYIEDQYLWSVDVARVFARALRRSPRLRMIIVVPRHLDDDSAMTIPPSLLGHAAALDLLRDAGADRVLVLDVENDDSVPVYVHSKVCIVDDVWAAVGSDNFNRRSWTHDSELTAAVVDEERDAREPVDPGGLGDGARVFARDLRLELLAEHLSRGSGADADVADLLDPDDCFDAVAEQVSELDAWHDGGRDGDRPRGRLRMHAIEVPPLWKQRVFSLLYRLVVDPDGRPLRLRLTRRF
ncbi:phosphatidylserine/phosphatidylglycerophosphate/cardiolipin synthase-like enzyme [Rhodococcus sp. SORGH_AS303]|nr:phosphatidylserine/phosphatidylglycerophosphate/cardiolipin synthase-like enzyme [Rhodococcus sp. SORGH_AS_0303]